ncbi:DUF262 domain-containing protein [Pseudomonas putida]|uniref:DUF262 domain-containing protein n=1 Tax=Pseudomonas putida TaxID=303 RepID=A0A8I1EIK3_PSEPU|nr:DUF262 domain-containing protein [Pseudomonas putida]MBI6885859.1 hypothetical protein [Pseudomonas putida]
MTTSYRIPKRRYFGQAMQAPMSSMRMQWKNRDEILAKQGYTGRSILGIKVPYWQRSNDKWSLAQKVAFINSIFAGATIGTYMVNTTPANDDLDQILLDGLQRLSAVQEYWEGKFAVPGEDGQPYFWADLTPGEQAHFDRIPFPWIDTNYSTEADCIDAYNRHNFGGIAHDESERAVARS